MPEEIIRIMEELSKMPDSVENNISYLKEKLNEHDLTEERREYLQSELERLENIKDSK